MYVDHSINEIFPLVAFNFEGGASIVLKPTNYLMHTGLLVSNFEGGASISHNCVY